ncbi:MAG: flippase-like domain-containing protein [Gemmatimonadota bacterium]|nr:flippase-like domain-containing protein [Gemmatimonadota bacterium]
MRIGWRGAFGIGLSAVLLWWVLHDNLRGVAEHLRTANIPLLLLAAALATAIFPLRARRWRTILSPIDRTIPFSVLWRSTAIGMMVNNVVPARAGEIARAYALSREQASVPFSTAFASLAVDRIFDAFVVMLLMLVAVLDPAFPNIPVAGRPVSNYVGGGAFVTAVGLVVLYLIVFFPEPLIRVYEIFARRLAPRLEARGRKTLLAFAAGLGVLRSPGRFFGVLFWTLLHWLTNALAFWVAFRAFGIRAPYSAALLLQGIIAIGVAVPSSPGFFGVFEYGARVGLVVYGVDPSLAVSWAIGFHLLSFVPITVIGAWYFTRLGLHFRELEGAAQDQRSDAPETPLGLGAPTPPPAERGAGAA